MVNKKITLQQCVTFSQVEKKLKTSKYGNTEPVLLEWFGLKQILNIPIKGLVLRHRAQEIALKVNIEFTPPNGWLDRFKKCAVPSYRTISRESESVKQRTCRILEDGSASNTSD
jgi:hypothetical protein